MDWDYLIELNSDDLIHNELLDIYDKRNDDYLGLSNFCFLDSKTGRMCQYRSKTVYGIGRRYSRRAVESCKYQEVQINVSCMSEAGSLNKDSVYDLRPNVARELIRVKYADAVSGERVKLWNDVATAGMDNEADRRLEQNGFRCKQVSTEKPLAVDIKSDVNIWKYADDPKNRYDFREFSKGLSEKEIELINGIITEHKTIITCNNS